MRGRISFHALHTKERSESDDDHLEPTCPKCISYQMASKEYSPETCASKIYVFPEEKRCGYKRVEFNRQEREDQQLANLPTSHPFYHLETIDSLDEGPICLCDLIKDHIDKIESQSACGHHKKPVQRAKCDECCRIDNKVNPVVYRLPHYKSRDLIDATNLRPQNFRDNENKERARKGQAP